MTKEQEIAINEMENIVASIIKKDLKLLKILAKY